MINILITASGGDIGQGVIKSLRLSKYKKIIRLVTTDINERAAGLFLGNKGYIISSAKQNKKNYIKQLKNICRKEKINIAFICNENEQHVVATQKNNLQQAVKTQFIVQPLNVINITHDKLRTYHELSAHGIRCPKSCVGKKNILAFIKKNGYPIVLKPRTGYGGFGKFKIINNKNDLTEYFKKNVVAHMICQEYISNKKNEEYTVGVFLNNNSKAIGAIAMLRQLRFSLTWHAIIDHYPDITNVAIRTAEAIGAIGPCNVQLRRDKNNQPCVIEINARISGTTAFRALAGFNEAEAAIDYFLKNRKPRLTHRHHLVAMKTWDDLVVPYKAYSKLKRTGTITN